MAGPTVDLGPVPGFVVIGAARYAMGRISYCVDETCQWIISIWPALPEDVRFVLRRDVDRLIRQDDESREKIRTGLVFHPAGHDCDRESWLSVQRLWKEEVGDGV